MRHFYKIGLIVFLMINSSVFSFAQTNLVYNGDFELYDTCPSNYSQPLDFQINHCTAWYMPTEGTSDYFNACNNTTVKVPNNILGYQQAFDGVGYCGLYANQFSMVLLQCLNGEYSEYGREYIQTKLLNQLKPNKNYKLIFYITKADTIGGYAIKNIGALFTTNAIGSNCFKPIIANHSIFHSICLINVVLTGSRIP